MKPEEWSEEYFCKNCGWVLGPMPKNLECPNCGMYYQLQAMAVSHVYRAAHPLPQWIDLEKRQETGEIMSVRDAPRP